MKEKSDIALIGLAVMGENLTLNFANKGFTVSAWDRDENVRSAFARGSAMDKSIRLCDSLESLVSSLETPRKVMLMVKAGDPVDQVIEQLSPWLQSGDIIIDGGNSHFADTERRVAELAHRGIHFVGAGVSGGEEGALNGPAIMPGGSEEAWPQVQPLLQSIAASADGRPCCDWIGAGGAGHFVKMVHNGIEYGDMQLICESYQFMQEILGLSSEEICQAYAKWSEGPLSSYLIEITKDIVGFEEEGEPLLGKVLDTAGQKGTGKWTAATALEMGTPVTLISEAVQARQLSARREERVVAARAYGASPLPTEGDGNNEGDRAAVLDALEQALLAAKIISYAQGFSLMRDAAEQFGWSLNYARIARGWRAGCIIRSGFLNNISQAFENNPALANLLLDDHFMAVINNAQTGWRKIVSSAIMHGLPCPALASALNYFDGYRCDKLPANLLQAQRDYFGAHRYERIDKPRGEFFHSDWSGRGGPTASTTYDV